MTEFLNGLLGVSITNSDKLVNPKKVFFPKISMNWLKLGFQLPNYLVLELTARHLLLFKAHCLVSYWYLA